MQRTSDIYIRIFIFSLFVGGGIASACSKSSSQKAENPPQSEDALACRATNLVLFGEPSDAPRTRILHLQEDGQLKVLISRYEGQPSFRLDPRGCVVADAEGNATVVIEMTKEGLWTPSRGVTSIDEGWIKSRESLASRIDSSGVVIHSGEDASTMGDFGQLRFEGMNEGGLCGAQMMLQFFYGMFGGLRGGGDGTPPTHPPPVSSVCPELHLPSSGT